MASATGVRRIGVLGGGQLGRMMTVAARRMGIQVISWVGGPDDGPAGMANHVIEGPFDDESAFEEFVRLSDVATVEFENIPRELLEKVSSRIPLRPNPQAIAICQHREREKLFLSKNGFPCAPFSIIDSKSALEAALAELPESGGILKTAEFGYDGKGQLPVSSSDDASLTWKEFNSPRAVLEDKIQLSSEVSVIVCRSQQGQIVTFDPVENIHRNHILDVSIAPARQPESVLSKAESVARELAEAMEYVGVLAVEYFISEGGELFVNEMAPRPHNSGHHTIEACVASQFEQQARAVAGLPLGSPGRRSIAVMQNLLGDVWNADGTPPDWNPILEIPGAYLHLYEKSASRPGRKMGHLTLIGDDLSSVLETLSMIRHQLSLPSV